MITWSHSALKDFEGCARRYYEVRVLKNYPFKAGDAEASNYGNQCHKAAEDYARDGIEPAPEFAFIKPVIDNLKKKPGRVFPEYEMALNSKLLPCDKWHPKVWVRGVADLLIVDDDNFLAWVVDWKTGKKKYPDREQLRLMSLMVFEHFPHIKKVNAGLVFLVEPHLERMSMMRDEKDRWWQDYRERVASMEQAKDANVWSPRQNAFCRKHCPVRSCEFNGRQD